MKINIHMESGKTLTQNGVKDYSIKWRGDEVVSLAIELKWYQKRTLILGSLNLSRIEAIEVYK